MSEMNELDLNTMEQASGGKNEGGYEKRPPEKAGCFIYKIERNDTLSKLAGRYHTTVDKIMRVNPELKNRNFIVTGCYIYIPA